MSKRTLFTTITPLPPQVSREIAMDTLHTHTEMIDLNPLVEERNPIKPPAKAPVEEFSRMWFEITDRVTYLPGGLYSGKVAYVGSFEDLPDGLRTHCYAPMGLDIKSRWTLAGSLPGEPQVPLTPKQVEEGVPASGLYLREDIDMRCNILMTGFVKKTLKKAHETLVARLMVKVQLQEKAVHNDQISELTYAPSNQSSPQLSSAYVGSVQGSPGFPPPNGIYSDSLRLGSQSPFGPGVTYQSLDQIGSIHSSPSPNAQIDPSYQNANPYLQQQQPQNQASPYSSYLPPDFAGNETLQYSMQDQMNSYASPNNGLNEVMDTEMNMGGQQGQHVISQPELMQSTFAPVDLQNHGQR